MEQDVRLDSKLDENEREEEDMGEDEEGRRRTAA